MNLFKLLSVAMLTVAVVNMSADDQEDAGEAIFVSGSRSYPIRMTQDNPEELVYSYSGGGY